MKKTTRKLAAILLACLMVTTLVACGSNTPTTNTPPPAPEKRDTLNVGVFLDPGTLDPLYMTGKGGYLSVLRTYSEPLWDYDFATGERFWVLATAFDKLDDEGLHYTLKVREGVTFSNGNPLTAEDILFTFRLNKADARAFLNVKCVDVEKTNVVDDYTLDVWYTHYDPSQDPGQVQMGIVDHRTYDINTFSDNPVGTGAYVVTDYLVNSHVTVAARDDYWGGAPEIKTINFKCLAEESQRVNALETGAVDMALIPMKEADYVESLGLRVDVLNFGASLASWYNLGADGPLGSVDARNAVSYATNSQAVSDVALSGRAELCRVGFSSYFLEVQDRYFDMHPAYTDRYNLDKAKELAEKSGLVGKTLRIVTNGDPNYNTAAEIVQDGLRLIGVNSNIIQYDQATYFNFLVTSVDEYDIAINEPVAPSNLPADILGNYPVFIPQDWTGPERDEYHALAQIMNSTYDQAKRMDLVYEVLQLHTKNHMWFGICENPYVMGINNDLTHIEYTVSGVTLHQKTRF